jgi:hypothetical protein
LSGTSIGVGIEGGSPMVGKRAAAAVLATLLSSCAGTDFGDAVFDAALVVGEAADIRECREQYARAGDAFRLADCEREATGR